MKSNVLLGIVLLACGAIANAGTRPDPQQPALPCTPGICFINVTVIKSQDGPSCTLQIDKPTVSAESSVVLAWIVNTDNFVFASDGIVFDDPEQFQAMPRPKANEIRMNDKHTRKGDFYYRVKVEGCTPLDPYIRNN